MVWLTKNFKASGFYNINTALGHWEPNISTLTYSLMISVSLPWNVSLEYNTHCRSAKLNSTDEVFKQGYKLLKVCDSFATNFCDIAAVLPEYLFYFMKDVWTDGATAKTSINTP